MTPYPDSRRATRALYRRRAAYQRTMTARYAHVLQRVVLGPLEDELGIDFKDVPTTAELLAPYREREAHLAARIRDRSRQLEPVFRRLYLNSRTASLDTETISTA
ncbi:hypothetical protein [Streptomyces pseudogriseolus]|uniref:hypothetical protein n=1 Tax=Streptomyces pseudogriseolus TaxID=36817 RepID=UPI003FA1BCA9